jgi:hypothetical protein
MYVLDARTPGNVQVVSSTVNAASPGILAGRQYHSISYPNDTDEALDRLRRYDFQVAGSRLREGCAVVVVVVAVVCQQLATVASAEKIVANA